MVMSIVPEYSEDAAGYPLEIKPDFPVAFRKYAEDHGIGPDTKILVTCRSGTRSAKAADLLADLGDRQVFTIVDGFEGEKVKDGANKGHRMVNGWKNAGLDWSYEIRPDQAYSADNM